MNRSESTRSPPPRSALWRQLRAYAQSIGSNCPICHRRAGDQRRVGDVPVTHHARFSVADYGLVHCSGCDVVRLDPLPVADDLKLLYEKSEQFNDAHYTDPAKIAAMLEYYGTCLDNLGLMPRTGEAMLEVGAGFAWVSRAAKQRNDRVRTVAQDVTAECATRCSWVDDYVVGSLAEVGAPHSFRLISLTHVIEHLVDPLAVLVELAGRLEPGGRFFITAPFRPPGWRSTGGIEPWLSYSYLHVPAHVSYLSRRWFEFACERCGLELLRWDSAQDGDQAFEAVLAKPERR
jgi:SAM-dependent methyltransferase